MYVIVYTTQSEVSVNHSDGCNLDRAKKLTARAFPHYDRA